MKALLNSLTCSVLTILISLSFSATANAGLLFNYSQLALKDLDQMAKLIQTKIAESRKAGGDKVIPIKEALQAVYTRPNEDFMIEKVITPLKNELEEHDAWESTIEALVKEAAGALNNPKAFKPVVQASYLIFLENLLAEMRPKAADTFENKVITQIRDYKIKLSKEAENERRLRMMKGSSSPSEVAAQILKDLEEAKKKEAAAAASESDS